MRTMIASLLVAFMASPAWSTRPAEDLGQRDVLSVVDLPASRGEVILEVHVNNDQELAALDIPLRFGQRGEPLELTKVEWTTRVADWDFQHAAIDNENKTVILGLISDLYGNRKDATLTGARSGESAIARLHFSAQGGVYPTLTPFITDEPAHFLSFIYNRTEGGMRRVKEFAPVFDAPVSYRQSTATLPTEYSVSPNFPNPFNPSTSFTLSLPQASDYTVRIFNVTGQVVRTYAGHLEAGVHTIGWDGRNEDGAVVSSGVYFYRASANGFEATRKMMMVK